MVRIEVVYRILERVTSVILGSPGRALEVAKAVKQAGQGGQGRQRFSQKESITDLLASIEGLAPRVSSRDVSLYVHARAADTETPKP